MRKAKAEKKKKKKREEEEDEGNITIPISTSNEKKKEKKEKNHYVENIAEGEPNNHMIKKKKKKNSVSEDVIGWKEEEKEEEEVLDYLPGQKHDRPGERDPLRIFYETLYQKVPDSELAETWMMEWGLLPPKIAEKVYETKFGQNQQMPASPKKTSKVPTTKEIKRLSNSTLKIKKRKSSEINSVDDFRPPKKKIKKQVSST
ncbi:protein PXR1 isoform X5 [Iris pallida]|uniref:Protein PXR1 isoform X5 n=1 Tax=Iris pallida TaxID=29817 RepID=A0AAX6HBM0_IRIPA|nr:protein PXR1 isoform X5 [Iris pallida]